MTNRNTFTESVYMSSALLDLDLMVAPDADLDGTFAAWCLDMNEEIKVNGWMFTIEATA